MNIVKVSMIGANEYLPAGDVVDFLRAYPMAEIGIGVSRGKGACGTPRFDYVMSLRRAYMKKYVPGETGTVALHINGNGKDGDAGWPVQLSDGKIPNSLCKMAKFPGMSVQLNHYGYSFRPENAPKLVGVFDLLRTYFAPKMRLILSYCDKTAPFVHAFFKEPDTIDMDCDILYDASFGNGRMTGEYRPPLYPYVRQGYAGGLGPENILAELDKINAAQTNPNAPIWIDAEGKLKSDDGKTLDLVKAEKFYNLIMEYQRAHGK